MLRRHRRPVSGLALAAEAGVSLRTVRRDVASLQAMGADIVGEAGVGYVLQPGFLLPPLMFTQEEIHALALGMQWVGGQADTAPAETAQDVMAKIGAALPDWLRDQLHDNGFYVEPHVAPDSISTGIFRTALRDQLKLEIVYRDHNDQYPKRRIWPISLGFIGVRRYVASWCEMRSGFRLFRVDRVIEATLSSERYPGRRREHLRRWRAESDAREVPRSGSD